MAHTLISLLYSVHWV